ncbi:MAG: radical SAM protein [archaeon]
MKKSVLLINPPFGLQERYGKILARFGAISEPLGIAYIASMLELHHISVTIIDAQVETLSTQNIVDQIDKNVYLIGITVLTPMFSAVEELCNQIKKRYPKIPIVLGGPHASALNEQVLEEIPAADIICFGEGELTFLELAKQDYQNLRDVKGICYRKNGQISINHARKLIKDIDDIPPPARHLLPMNRYKLTTSRVMHDTYCPTLIVARGCRFACTYCSKTFGNTLRKHSIKRIMSEIGVLIHKYRAKQINIEADNLTVDKKFVFELCSSLIKKGYHKKLRWTCESRVDTVDEPMLRFMKKAGCWQISYGVESGSQRLLDLVHKDTQKSQIEKTFQLTKKAGISIRGFFMLGLPTETVSESRETIEFAKKLDPHWAQFTLTIPYPGTKMFTQLKHKGYLSLDWDSYNTWNGWIENAKLPYVTSGRTEEELKKLQRTAMREFYFRPKTILRHLLSIKSIHDLLRDINGAMILAKH